MELEDWNDWKVVITVTTWKPETPESWNDSKAGTTEMTINWNLLECLPHHYIGGIMTVAPIGIKDFAVFLDVCDINKKVLDGL